ncbi:MAG: redoxin family protein [Bdellovibrionales bacterium]|nr:redoxin family protein [Bdellovibrionales bacterium]
MAFLIVRILFFAGVLVSVSCASIGKHRSSTSAYSCCAGKKDKASASSCSHCASKKDKTSSCSHCASKKDKASPCSHCASKKDKTSSCSHCASKKDKTSSCSHCASKKDKASSCSHCASKKDKASSCSHCASKKDKASSCSHCASKKDKASTSACCASKNSDAKGHSHSTPEKEHKGHAVVPSAGDSSSAKREIHSASDPEKKASALNRIVEDLKISPVNGPEFKLSALKKPKAIVFVMREKDCPISEKYGPRLARLEKDYSKKGIQFIYNYVGQVRSEESAKKDLEIQKFKAPYVIDTKQKVVHALSAKTTGDVFILTPERKVVYRGPVDDQYHLLKSALKPRNHYVKDILEAIAQGKAFTSQELPAPGCFISPPIGQASS